MLGLALATLLLAGCAAGSPSGSSAVPTIVASADAEADEAAPPQPATSEAAAPEPAAVEPATVEPATTEAAAPVTPDVEELFTMPDTVGQNLQYAQDSLQALGSYLMDQTDASGLGRMQINDSNWVVCSQDPAPGSIVAISTVVALAAVKIGEAC